VRHDWGPTATSSTNGFAISSSSSSRHEEVANAVLEVALQVFAAVKRTSHESIDFVQQHVTDSSKSPALLSLLLSCMKRLQGNCERMPYRVTALAAGAAELALQLAGLCSTGSCGSAASISTGTGPTHSSSNSSSMSASTTDSRSTSEVPVSSSSIASPTDLAGRVQLPQQFSPEGTTAASAWLVLFGRSLFTTGAAMQVLKASNAALSETDRRPPDAGVSGAVDVPISAYVMLRDLYSAVRKYSRLVDLYVASAPEGAAAASATGCKRVQVTLTKTGLAQPVLQAYSSLSAALEAGEAYSKALLVAEGLVSVGKGASLAELSTMLEAKKLDAAVNGRMWGRFLASEHGQMLPQALLDTGSLLCAALPTRYCCNEPSCCCIDRPSELQLAGGKGSQCSGCGVARYCGAVHQRQHWKMHKGVCRAISAAATAAAAER
jgi:hypothetical protein